MEENKTNEGVSTEGVSTQEHVEQDANNYIEAIKEMKANSVSKAAYDKLKEENKQLLDSLINGGQVTYEQHASQPVDVQKLRNKLADQDAQLSNLEYAKTALELRDAVIEQGGQDPFLPWGVNISPTTDDVEKANHVAEVFRDCIEYADGDSEIFTNELMRRTNDAMPIRSKLKQARR